MIARVREMHAHYYATVADFGREFAFSVASNMAEFIGRLDNPSNEIWTIKRDDKIHLLPLMVHCGRLFKRFRTR
ncbi:hypothetical protein ALT785_270010 [Alteromonas infernus]